MSAITAKSPPATKCCNHCGKRLPSAAFRRVYRDRDWPRHSECNGCRNSADRERRRCQRRSTLKSQRTALAAADDVQRLKALATSMVASAGGFNRFCEQFAEVWNDPTATPATQQRTIAAVLNMATAAEQAAWFAEQQRQAAETQRREQSRDALGRMSECELEEHAADTLRRAGWRVRPPRFAD